MRPHDNLHHIEIIPPDEVLQGAQPNVRLEARRDDESADQDEGGAIAGMVLAVHHDGRETRVDYENRDDDVLDNEDGVFPLQIERDLTLLDIDTAARDARALRDHRVRRVVRVEAPLARVWKEARLLPRANLVARRSSTGRDEGQGSKWGSRLESVRCLEDA